jgi:hypothetical protein
MVEEDVQQSKGQAGLDHTPVRRYRSWLRHAVLAIAVLPTRAVTTIHPTTTTSSPRTVPEIHRIRAGQ